MESRERKLCNNYPPWIKTEKNQFWRKGSSSMERKKKEHKQMYYLVSSHVNHLSAKLLGQIFLEGNTI
jgi:hypothetical protein